MQLLWNFVTSLVAPDEEEEGIHQLTETLTRKGASPHHCSPFNKDQDKLDAYPVRLALAIFILQDRNIKMSKKMATNIGLIYALMSHYNSLTGEIHEASDYVPPYLFIQLSESMAH